MGTWMRDLYESEAARSGAVEILRQVGESELAAVFEGSVDSAVLSTELGSALSPIANALERAAVTEGTDVHGPNTINFATSLRIFGPPGALRGEPLEWREHGPHGMLIATDPRGKSWDIQRHRGSFGLTVAQWDRPDWWLETEELARTMAAEIVARPSFSRASMANAEIEIPFD